MESKRKVSTADETPWINCPQNYPMGLKVAYPLATFDFRRGMVEEPSIKNAEP